MWTLLLWLPRFIKYEVVPIQLRYVVWVLLLPFQGIQRLLHRQLVLQGMVAHLAFLACTSANQHEVCVHVRPQVLHWMLRSLEVGVECYCWHTVHTGTVRIITRFLHLTGGSFSRARVLRRWHGTQSAMDDLVYRWRLLLGKQR